MYKDCHLHTTISHDGQSSVWEYIAAAHEKHVDEILLTEHYDDYTGIDTELHTLSVDAYASEYRRIREKTDFPIGFGIEIGLRPECAEKTKQMAHLYSFDFIIGSSHITAGIDMAYDPSFFEGRTRRDAYLLYFSEVLKNVQIYDEFDVYGHLDYVARYGGYPGGRIRYAEFSDVFDEIFRTLIRKGKGIEINTSGLRYGLGSFCPGADLVKRYLDLGGEIITLGSDARKAFISPVFILYMTKTGFFLFDANFQIFFSPICRRCMEYALRKNKTPFKMTGIRQSTATITISSQLRWTPAPATTVNIEITAAANTIVNPVRTFGFSFSTTRSA